MFQVFNGLRGCVFVCLCERVYTCAPMRVICFMQVLFVYRLTLILKITGLGLFNVINQEGNDWFLLNMIKWSSELSLHVPSKLFESMGALKTGFCLWKQSHADPNWPRNENRRKDSNNSVFFFLFFFSICCRVWRVILWSKSRWVRVRAMPERR